MPLDWLCYNNSEMPELGASPPITKVEMSQAGGYHYLMETDVKLSINHLYPPILGDTPGASAGNILHILFSGLDKMLFL